MKYKTIEENPIFRAGREYGKYVFEQINPAPTKKREYHLYENKVFINDS